MVFDRSFSFSCFRLKDWIEKKAEREREREKRREERREKRLQFLQGPKHKFDDPDYDKQKMQVSEHLEEALQQGKCSYTVQSRDIICYLFSG